MKTISVNLFEYNELSDKAKEKALEDNRDYNIYDMWYDSIYDDANTMSLVISAFDLYRRTISIDFDTFPEDSIGAILKNAGKTTELHKTATRYYASLEELKREHIQRQAFLDEEDEGDEEERFEETETYEEWRDEFIKDLGEDYLSLLRQEYEYQTSDTAIIESFEANEVMFMENGTISTL